MEEIAKHPLFVAAVLVVVNLILVPSVGAWVRSGISTQVTLALVPITIELKDIQSKIAELKIEQVRTTQKIDDHIASDEKEFHRVRNDMGSLENRVYARLGQNGR